MDYKQKYEEALENIKKIKAANKDNKELVDFIEFKYTGLKENKDEKIKKEIIDYLKSFIPHNDYDLVTKSKVWIAYLEKQGEQNPTNKFEPKFKAGDYIINEHGFIMQIDGIDNNTYIYHVLDNSNERLTYDITKTDKSCHLWTLKDVKDGDVIASNQIIILFKKFQEESDCNYVIAYAGIDVSGELQITDGHWLISNDAKPATKEQRELLFRKIVEKDYIWDPEKKELNKIKQILNWSEEDEKISNAIYESIDFLCLDFSEDKVRDWLKSIKERIKLAL